MEVDDVPAAPKPEQKKATNHQPAKAHTGAIDDAMDVRPDVHLEQKVNAERAIENEADLLDTSQPVE